MHNTLTPADILNEFGYTLTITNAHRYIASHGGVSHMDNGTLVFRYPGCERRRVEPIFVSGAGWLVPLNEVKP